MSDLTRGYDALTAAVTTEPLAPQEVRDGSPRAGVAELGQYAGCEVGVWEMTPGVATDTETDELFVVLSGRATVRFLDEDRSVELSAGSVVQLVEGQRTEWTVTETLRKVYLAAD